MKPVIQTIIDKDTGNCWTAAIASVLELEISAVPNFMQESGVSGFYNHATRWLSTFGLMILRVRMPKEYLTGDDIRFHPLPECICIATGKSPRGDYYHSVVGKIVDGFNFSMTHDPHPSSDGIDGLPICIEFIVPLDPRL